MSARKRLQDQPRAAPGAGWDQFGALAQLGERLICIQEVIGSIPIGSTRSLGDLVSARKRLRKQLRAPPGSQLAPQTQHNGSIIERITRCAGSSNRTELNDIVKSNTSVSPVDPSMDPPRGTPGDGDTVKSSTLTKCHAKCVARCSMLLVRKSSDALSGSDQARKGRLVDALAARGDEGRDTLR